MNYFESIFMCIYLQLILGGVIGLSSSIITLFLNNRHQIMLLDKKNKQEHLLDDKNHIRTILMDLINNADFKNPETHTIGAAWQWKIQTQINSFADNRNPHKRDLLGAISEFSMKYDLHQLAFKKVTRDKDQNSINISIDAGNQFNNACEKLTTTINNYFKYYST